MDAKTFFDKVRKPVFGGSMSQQQVEGCETLIAHFERAKWPLRWAAYGLATTELETAHTMQPIKEHGSDAYFKKMYDIKGDRPEKAKELGNVNPGDGARYCGRGYVQITGRANYRSVGKKIGVDLENEPQRALEPEIAAKVLIGGMAGGWFTGKDLDDYLGTDYLNARRIVNGTDRAREIAAIAKSFEDGLRAAGYGPKECTCPCTCGARQ